MTTTPVPPVDVDLLREEIRKTYAAVSQEPEREFIFPRGCWVARLTHRERQKLGKGSRP